MRFLFYLLAVLALVSVGFLGGFLYKNSKGTDLQKVLPASIAKKNPFDKYQIESLQKMEIPKGQFEIVETKEEFDDFISYYFFFNFDPSLSGSDVKIMSGIINIPKNQQKYPLVLMLRGFVDQSIYKSGMGTEHAAEAFAKAGYVTIAPDFFGYGLSEPESGNIFETRFQSYTTALSLLSSFSDPTFTKLAGDKWDEKNLFIWAHSNGGQIALTTLAASGATIPTVLWAPVSKPFPYSILYYLDEAEDGGKFLRRELAKFEEQNDVNAFSFTNYYKDIKATFQISQGAADDAIPVAWTNALVKNLEAQNLDVDYLILPGADHNMVPRWDEAIKKALDFYEENMQY